MVSGTSSEEQNQHQLEREIHGMISKLNDQLAALGKSKASSSTGHRQTEDADHGLRMITLSGGNKGATMRASGLDELADTTHGMIHGDDEKLSAYTNSNYQAINNSIMFGGSCAAEDPGVHIVISEDYVQEEDEDAAAAAAYYEEDIHAKKEKEKEKEKKTTSKVEHLGEEKN